jgi:gamma-glutamyltranspeptidase
VAIPSAPTRASHGLVVSPHTVASEAGRSILGQGGNAVDAAIATNAALAVTYPHMNGLGGDSLWLIYDAHSRQIYGLNGSGRSAQAATLDRFQGQEMIPQRGPLAALMVPGTVDSWWQAHQRFGRLPWATLLQPAIQLAAQGYSISASQARWTQQDQALLSADSGAAATFLPGGHVPRTGDRVQNPDLAAVLTAIADQGVEVFYRGDLAKRLVDWLANQGGLLSLDDFAQYQSDWVEPIYSPYRGHRIYELPPNTQGLTVLQILNLIEGFDLQTLGHGTADYYHLLVEATKLAFCDRDRWITDPDFLDIPVAELIAKPYAHRRSGRISLSQAQTYTATPLGGDTTYSAVVDAQGNAVSLIQSLYFDYGAGIVPARLGFILNNRATLFSLDPHHPNCLASRKRSFHTLIPAMSLTPSGHLDLIFGTMGGEGQPQTQVALLTRVLDFGFDIQTAVNLPRWRWGRTWGSSSAELVLERRIPPEICQVLQSRGHTIRTTSDWSEAMGHAHMIRLTPEGFEGACDPRSDGIAVGN